MFYPQASFYPQPNFYPQGSFGGQSNFNTQTGFGALGLQGNPYIPVNAPYGVPQPMPALAQGASAQGLSPHQNWQHFAPQTGLQQQAIQQLLAQQLTLAAQSAQGIAGAYPFAGQFIPNQWGTNFVPGTTH